MASKSQKTDTKRNQKRHKAGKARKRALRRDGSTPKFPLDPNG